MHEEFAYYNEHIRCYRSGKIERLNKPRSKYGKAGSWTEVKPTVAQDGYLRVKVNGKMFKWHRVIWIAFNGSIPDGLQVNHRDEVKTNNSLDNLELMTPKKNCCYGTRNERIGKAQSKPVIGINVKTGERIEFPSTMEAGRNGFSQGDIVLCIQGKFKSHKGYRWYYKSDFEHNA